MYPNSIYFGLKVVPIEVLWGQSILYLSTWTLRVTLHRSAKTNGAAVKARCAERAGDRLAKCQVPCIEV